MSSFFRPDYHSACAGGSGHTEAIQVYYDENVVSYTELVNVLWGSIDPTVVNGQGNDRGPQYRTGIYYHTEEQRDIALQTLEEQQQKFKSPIATEIKPAKLYWPAELEHQDYLQIGGRFGSSQSAEKGCRDEIRCYG